MANLTAEQNPYNLALEQLMLAWCRLRALGEEEGLLMTMEIKVKEAPKNKRKRRAK